jgi:hypothetical protein
MLAFSQAFRIAFFAPLGVKPGKTRLSAVRSSGGQVSCTSTISQDGTATQRLALAVLP